MSATKNKFPKSMVGEIKANYQTNILWEQTKITSSQNAADELRKRWPLDIEYREAFLVLYMNRANKTIGHAVISTGGISATVVDPKIVFQHGLICNASAMILSHNHPSGETKPSNSDLELTKSLKEFAKMIEMPVLDHIILTNESYYSFADNGLI